LVATLLVGSTTLLAQQEDYSLRVFSVNDGLPSRTVHSVTQDTSGLIWIGTNSGMVSFDGQQFIRTRDTTGLSRTGGVLEIFQKKNGHFLARKEGGKYFEFNPFEGGAVDTMSIPGYSRLMPLTDANIAYYYDSNSDLFSTSNRKDFHLVAHKPKTQHSSWALSPTNTVLINEPEKLLITELNHIGDTIRRYRKTSNTYSNDFLQKGYVSESVGSQITDTSSLFRDIVKPYGSDTTLFNFPLKIKGQPFSKNHIVDLGGDSVNIYLDKDGNYWVSFTNHLWLFDVTGRLIVDFSARINKNFNIEFGLLDMYQDNQGRMWIGTTLGLLLIEKRNNYFTNYLAEGPTKSIRGITQLTDSTILVGASNSNKVINLNTKKSTADINPHIILGVDYGPDGTMFTGTYGEGSFLRPGEETFYRYENNPASFKMFLPFYDDASGILFYGTRQGLCYITSEGEPVLPYEKVNEFSLFKNHQVSWIAKNDKGLWVSGTQGLFCVSVKEGVLQHFSYRSLSFKHFHEDQDGIFWIATDGGGLLRWNPEGNQVRQYSIQQGLVNDVLYAVYPDQSGNLWLPSNRGLMRFNPRTETVDSFQPEDGIPHEEFNTYSHFKAADGRLYFGTVSGLTSFHPEEINLSQNKSPMWVSDLQQYNNTTKQIENRLAEFRQDGQIELAPGDRFFSIGFSLLDYSARTITYAWMVEGHDDHWAYQDNNTLRISGLPYGKHTLRIKGRGVGGKWSESELAIPVIIRRPFYLTIPFVLFSILALAGLIWAYILRRTTRLKKEQLKLKKLVRQRTTELAQKNDELEKSNLTKDRLFALISHDLRAPIISVRSITRKVDYLIKNNRMDEVRSMSSLVDHTVENTQKLLDNLLSWAIAQRTDLPYEPEAFVPEDLVNEIIDLFQITANTKNIELALVAPEKATAFADPKGILTILRNLVDNALKFTHPGGKVTLSIKPKANKKTIHITVKDNGQGISKEVIQQLFSLGKKQVSKGTKGEKGVGLGLTLSKDLAKINQGELTLVSTSTTGSTFLLSLPATKQK
jgi:signal transduction histidine kinase/ligand-binding sensor domain-containing protein